MSKLVSMIVSGAIALGATAMLGNTFEVQMSELNRTFDQVIQEV